MRYDSIGFKTNLAAKFDIFCLFFVFFSKKQKALNEILFEHAIPIHLNSVVQWTHFFWIHMTSTINHPFTVQFDNSCIDLRAFSGKISLNLPVHKGFHKEIVLPTKCRKKKKWSTHILINLMTKGLSQLQPLITKQKRD